MRVFFNVSLLLFGAVMVQAGYADAEAEAKYRQSVMKSVGGHMAAMGTILKSQVHLGDLAAHHR